MNTTNLASMILVLLSTFKIGCMLVWKKASHYNNLQCLIYSEVLSVRSSLYCSVQCDLSTTCQAFIFSSAANNTCQLLDDIKTASNDFVVSMNAGYYIMDSVCGVPSDEKTFRSLVLSDGSILKYRIVREPKTQSQAAVRCTELGSSLFKPSTVVKFTMMRSVVMTCSDFRSYEYHVGGGNSAASNFADINQWLTSNGDVVPVDTWASGYPMNTDNNHCLELCAYNDYFLINIACSFKTYFICEQ